MAYNPNTIWISHTSLNDFEKCKQLYYLRNLYRDKKYGNSFRLQVASPFLSLGEAVHDAIDHFTERYEPEHRTLDRLIYEYKRGWSLKPGKIGGYRDSSQEQEFKERGEAMLERFFKHSHFSKGKPIRVNFPKFPLKGEDDVVLVGNFDWLEEIDGGLHVMDFKTGKEESEDSLQLPIYAILAEHVLNKPVKKVSYWYLDRDEEPVETKIPDLDKTLATVKEKASKMEDAIKFQDFPCIAEIGYCKHCHEYYKVIHDQAEHVQTDFKRKREVFYLEQ